MLYVFIGCLAFGILYTAFSFVLGGGGDNGAGDIDAGDGIDIGGDIDIGDGMDLDLDIDAGGDADIGAAADVGDTSDTGSPSPFSPLVIASAITTFGAVGLISMIGFGLDGLVSTFVSLGFAGAIGAGLFFGVVKFMYGSQSNSVFSLNEIVGNEADVITPVPERGLGEIAYSARGTRTTLTARSGDGHAIRKGSTVIIREIVGNVAVVQQKLTLDDVILEDTSEHDPEGNEAGDSKK